MGVHRANDWLLFGGKASAQELQTLGLVNKIFPKEGFHGAVHDYLKGQLKDRDGKSLMEMKRLQNARLRDQRLLSLFEAWNALSEKFVEGEPLRRMTAKMNELAGEFVRTIDEPIKLLTLQQPRGRPDQPNCRFSLLDLIVAPLTNVSSFISPLAISEVMTVIKIEIIRQGHIAEEHRRDFYYIVHHSP